MSQNFNFHSFEIYLYSVHDQIWSFFMYKLGNIFLLQAQYYWIYSHLAYGLKCLINANLINKKINCKTNHYFGKQNKHTYNVVKSPRKQKQKMLLIFYNLRVEIWAFTCFSNIYSPLVLAYFHIFIDMFLYLFHMCVMFIIF